MRDKLNQDNAASKALSSIDPLLFEGRGVMYNRKTPLHQDKLDPHRGWAALLALGEFKTGGELSIPRLKLKVRYLPGDLILIRGRILPHEVLDWDGKQRISIVMFTHTDMWKKYLV